VRPSVYVVDPAVEQAVRSLPWPRDSAFFCHSSARCRYFSASQLSGMIPLSPWEIQSSSFRQLRTLSKRSGCRTRRLIRCSGEMDTQQLRAKAMHFRRVALLLSDVEASEALLELAAEYESLADDLAEQEPNPRGR